MAAEAVKIPLAAKKEMKEAEPKLVEAGAAIGTAVGTEAYKIDFLGDYTAILNYPTPMANKYTSVGQLAEYYTAVAKNIETHAKADPAWAALFVKRTEKREVHIKIVDDMYKLRDAGTGDVALKSSSGDEVGLQIVDGLVNVMTTPSKYGYSIHLIGSLDLSKMFRPEEGELSLQDLTTIRNRDEKIKSAVERIEKATGVAPIAWDINADCIGAYATKQIHQKDGVVDGCVEYMKTLAEALERACKEEMLKEAIAEELTKNKKISVKVVADAAAMKKLPSVASNDSCNGIQIADGQIVVLTHPKGWFTNTNELLRCNLMALF